MIAPAFRTPGPAGPPLPIGFHYFTGTRCPACGGTNFHVGRTTAECGAARCGHAMLLAGERRAA